MAELQPAAALFRGLECWRQRRMVVYELSGVDQTTAAMTWHDFLYELLRFERTRFTTRVLP